MLSSSLLRTNLPMLLAWEEGVHVWRVLLSGYSLCNAICNMKPPCLGFLCSEHHDLSVLDDQNLSQKDVLIRSLPRISAISHGFTRFFRAISP